jgi:hypothetical protein
MTALAGPLAAAAEAAGQTFEVAVDDTIHFEEPEEEPTEQEAKDKLAAFTDAGEQGAHVAGEEDRSDAQGRSCSQRCNSLNTWTAYDKKAVGAYVLCPLPPSSALSFVCFFRCNPFAGRPRVSSSPFSTC